MKKKSLRKKHSRKRKKPLFENNIISGFFLLFSLFFVFFYFFYINSLFQIEEIEIKSFENVNEDALENFIERKTEKRFLLFNRKSIVFFSSEKTKKSILETASVIKDISIKKIFPAKLEVVLIERVPFAVWCVKFERDFCFHIDKEGVVFQKTENLDSHSLVIMNKDHFSLGDKVIDEYLLEDIYYLKSKLSEIDIKVKYFDISTKNTIEVFTEDDLKILLFPNKVEEQTENLRVILNKINQEEIVDYIDLRFGDRIYYK